MKSVRDPIDPFSKRVEISLHFLKEKWTFGGMLDEIRNHNWSFFETSRNVPSFFERKMDFLRNPWWNQKDYQLILFQTESKCPFIFWRKNGLFAESLMKSVITIGTFSKRVQMSLHFLKKNKLLTESLMKSVITIGYFSKRVQMSLLFFETKMTFWRNPWWKQ